MEHKIPNLFQEQQKEMSSGCLSLTMRWACFRVWGWKGHALLPLSAPSSHCSAAVQLQGYHLKHIENQHIHTSSLWVLILCWLFVVHVHVPRSLKRSLQARWKLILDTAWQLAVFTLTSDTDRSSTRTFSTFCLWSSLRFSATLTVGKLSQYPYDFQT